MQKPVSEILKTENFTDELATMMKLGTLQACIPKLYLEIAMSVSLIIMPQLSDKLTKKSWLCIGLF